MAFKLQSILSVFSIYPQKTIHAFASIPWYLFDLFKYSRLSNNEKIHILPSLHDKHSQAASLGEYFWQDLLVAQLILSSNPEKVVDVGSRIDGYVSHVASQRQIFVMDIRPLAHKIPNVEFMQYDITSRTASPPIVTDCLTCLHTLEHVGLGRYGDLVDPSSWITALGNLSDFLSPNGILWLSVPVGRKCVKFNTHRVFDFNELLAQATLLGLKPMHAAVYTSSRMSPILSIDEAQSTINPNQYNLVIINFRKL